MTKEEWKGLLGKLADSIDYSNFKNSVKMGRYHDALLRAWTVMLMSKKGRNN